MNSSIDSIKNIATDTEDFIFLWKTLSEKEKRTLLFHMLEGGIVNKLQSIALSGEDLIHSDETGSNLLHHAAMSDNPEVITCLLYLGCDIDKKDNNGRTPLHIASSMGNINSLKVILENKNKWRDKDKLGKTYLNVAKEGYKLKIAIHSLIILVKKIF